MHLFDHGFIDIISLGNVSFMLIHLQSSAYCAYRLELRAQYASEMYNSFYYTPRPILISISVDAISRNRH